MDVKLIEKIVREFFPAGSPEHGVTMELADDSVRVDGDEIRATFRLMEWQAGGGEPIMVAVKEQGVGMGRLEHLEDLGRYRAFLACANERIAGLSAADALSWMPEDAFERDRLDTGHDDGTIE